jgi:formamidase
LQGDGEIAGHTCDVAGSVILQVHVIKNLPIDGPILLPLLEDLPFLARPLSAKEEHQALQIAKNWGVTRLERSAPISVVGTAPNLNDATECGLQRAARLLEMSIPEIKNRATISGAIEIGRHPGVVQVTFRAPIDLLEQRGLMPFVCDQYGIRK